LPISLKDFQYLKDTLLRLGSICLEDGKKDLAETALLRMCTKESIPNLDQFFMRLCSDTTGRLSSKHIENYFSFAELVR